MEPIEKSSSLAEIAYERIKQSIVDTTLKPGRTIYEPRLAESLGISRTPVREALIRLEQEGWLKSARGQGLVVTSVSSRDVEYIYEMRLLLEPRAAGHFIEQASDEQIAALIEPIEEVEADIEAGNYDLYFRVHHRLHHAIIDLCPNPLLQHMLVHLDDHMRRIRIFTGFDPKRHVHPSFGEQKRILRAISRRDVQQVERYMAEHLRAARKRILAQLEASTTNGS